MRPGRATLLRASRENFLCTIKAGPAGGRLRRPSCADNDTTVTRS
jgi:hypothetical protein